MIVSFRSESKARLQIASEAAGDLGPISNSHLFKFSMDAHIKGIPIGFGNIPVYLLDADRAQPAEGDR